MKKVLNIFIVLLVSAISTVSVQAERYKGHEYVDLGLPSGTLWATCNVGADSPEAYGDYFAWGETTTKDHYDISTYKYASGYHSTLSKYNNKTKWGAVDNKSTLEAADDAATANWGGAWRMPTRTEYNELLTNCTWKKTTDYNGTGVWGYVVTSKKDATKHIFLPAAGSHCGESVGSQGWSGTYWSSTLDGTYPPYGYVLEFYLEKLGENVYFRDLGFSVRAVCKGVTPDPEEIYFDVNVVAQDGIGGTVTGTGEYLYNTLVTIEAFANKEFQFKQWSDGNTENPRKVTVLSDTTFVAEFEGVTGIKVYPKDVTVEVAWDKIENAQFYMFNIFTTTDEYVTNSFKPATPADESRLFQTISGLAPETSYILRFQYAIGDELSPVQKVLFTTEKKTILSGTEHMIVEYIGGVRKVLENGTIYIVRGTEKYTIDGRKVK